MRDAFVRAVIRLAKHDTKLMVISGDLGFGVFEDFETQFPEQFLNCGVAEQLMTGLATGMSRNEECVFTYSIGNFPTLRCLEQIRNGAAYHECNVNIVSVGGGFSYGSLGMSHHATEDIAIMRALPNVDVFVPCSSYETEKLVEIAYSRSGRVSYLRLDKTEAIETNEVEDFAFGKLRRFTPGERVAVICSGGILNEALKAREILEDHKIDLAVYSCHSIKPFDESGLERIADTYEYLITLEEHSVIGGLGGAVSELLASRPGRSVNYIRMGLQDVYSSVVGDASYLRNYYRIDASALTNTIIELLR